VYEPVVISEGCKKAFPEIHFRVVTKRLQSENSFWQFPVIFHELVRITYWAIFNAKMSVQLSMP